jgi:hypothetical protein
VNPYLILAAVLVWLASSAGVGYWQNQAGHAAERGKWQARENEQLTTANAKIMELQEAARAEERAKAQAVAAISEKYEKEKIDAAAQKARDIAAARAGALSLRIPAPSCPGAGGGETGAAPAAAGERDGRAPGELPREVTANLLALADDADEVVQQLSACQAVVRADRP